MPVGPHILWEEKAKSHNRGLEHRPSNEVCSVLRQPPLSPRVYGQWRQFPLRG